MAAILYSVAYWCLKVLTPNRNANIMSNTTLNIGVIGGGISGITAAWLLSRQYSVTLIEKEAQLGGHTHTHCLDSGPDAGTPIDMGFIVLNDRNYPTLLTLFSQWGVRVQNSDMSFGFEDKESGFYYSSDVPRGLFARRRNLISPCLWQLIWDMLRFNRIGARELRTGLGQMTLGQFLQKYGFSKAYIDFHIVPVSSAVWSTPSENILDFPAESILRFYDNHGTLTLANRPQWQTVVGGSVSYIQAFEKRFQGAVKKASPVRHVRRMTDRVKVILEDRTEMNFDRIVLATHADISHQLLANPNSEETRLLSKWSYTKNQVTLHTDVKVMPPRRSAWASWNYVRFGGTQRKPVMNMSYYMNRLQRLKTTNDHFVTLNGDAWIDPNRKIESVTFDHPCYTFDSLSTHKELDAINGKDRVFYCGAYCGYGFHEDGARSGLAVAQKFGIGL
jgi:predicted NAD/FAD-binding protein